MSNILLSSNMNLPIPVTGTDPGPDWANNLNASLTIVDGHNHTPGNGVPVPSQGLNINADLPFNGNNLITARSLRLSVQPAALANASDLGCLYVTGVDLYFNDEAGNQIQITQNGGIAGSPGSISNLTSPASASYVAGSATFVWQSDVNTAANMDGGSVIIREVAASAKGITIKSPSALSSDYNITLPAAVAAANNSFLTMANDGTMSNVITVDGTSITIAANKLVASTQLSAASQAQVDAGTSATTFVSPSTLAGKTRMAIFTTAGTHTWTCPVGVTEVIVYGKGGGGGGGGGGYGQNPTLKGGGGGGGGGTTAQSMYFSVTAGVQYTVIVGDGGAGGSAAAGQGLGGGNGSPGVASSFGGTTFRNIGAGGSGGGGNGQTGGVGGNASAFSWGGTGGTGGAGGSSGFAGDNSLNKSGGAAGTGDTFTGAGGGGGAGDANGGAGGNASSGAAGAGSAGSGGGGGHGGNPGTGATPAVGGKGGAGAIAIVYVDKSTTNVDT